MSLTKRIESDFVSERSEFKSAPFSLSVRQRRDLARPPMARRGGKNRIEIYQGQFLWVLIKPRSSVFQMIGKRNIFVLRPAFFHVYESRMRKSLFLNSDYKIGFSSLHSKACCLSFLKYPCPEDIYN
jgi:hypothetical protein